VEWMAVPVCACSARSIQTSAAAGGSGARRCGLGSDHRALGSPDPPDREAQLADKSLKTNSTMLVPQFTLFLWDISHQDCEISHRKRVIRVTTILLRRHGPSFRSCDANSCL
jgi:hypothetical protein